jgi:iron complex transport system permease protein
VFRPSPSSAKEEGLFLNIEHTRMRPWVCALGLAAAFLAVAAPALLVGAADLPAAEVFRALAGHGEEGVRLIVLDIRLPRVVLAFLVGSALAVSGVVFQGLLVNPLAGPYTLGISSGAAFGASLAIWAGTALWSLPLAALGGAGLTLLAVLLLSRGSAGHEPRSLILAGIVVGAILSAAVSLIKTLSGESLSAIVFWIMGSLSGRGWDEVRTLTPYLAVGLAGILVFARDLDLLCLGTDHAHAAGVDVRAHRQLLLVFASLVAAAAVSVSGVIGFVGLVAPHTFRMLLGPGHRRLTLFSLFGGGLLLVYADTLARWLSRGGDLPVGVVTALLGGPLFCVLLARRQRSEGW